MSGEEPPKEYLFPQPNFFMHLHYTEQDVLKLILEDSGLEPKWVDIIKNDPELYEYLHMAVSGLVTYYTEKKGGQLPLYPTMILEALKYCRPADVQLVIVGHDPIPVLELATGLAFSYPDGKTEKNVPVIGPGSSARKVHDALKAAGIEPGQNLNHQHWAEKGVLLLNACLTIDPYNKTEPRQGGGVENPHFKHWRNFTYRLLVLLQQIRQERQKTSPVFVLCWGTHAGDLGEDLIKELSLAARYVYRNNTDHKTDPKKLRGAKTVVYMGNHPTFHLYGTNYSFDEQGPNQFRIINHFYKGLFDEPAATPSNQRDAPRGLSDNNDGTDELAQEFKQKVTV